MAEPIGIASGVVALATIAFKSSISLYNTIESYRSHQQRVRDLAEETNALSAVLASLTETAKATDELGLSMLEIPLRRCGRACEEFQREIQKFSSRSKGDKGSFRDWARLRYMGEDIDGFRRLLAGYKMTISIALTDSNLRTSIITAESIENYNELLNTARADLEDRLERIDEKLDIMITQNMVDTPDINQTKEERLSTEKCLQICSQLSEHISRIQLHAGSKGSTENGSNAERMTSETLQECKEQLARLAINLADHEKRLFDRLADKIKGANAPQDDLADIARLRDEWESTRQSMEFLSKAGNHFEQNVSVIENHGTGDSMQVMVSANGKTLHGTNRGLGWRTRQIGGYLSDETVREISRNMMSMSVPSDSDVSLQPDETPNAPSIKSEGNRNAGFKDRFGKGFKLMSESTSEVTTPSGDRGKSV